MCKGNLAFRDFKITLHLAAIVPAGFGFGNMFWTVADHCDRAQLASQDLDIFPAHLEIMALQPWASKDCNRALKQYRSVEWA